MAPPPRPIQNLLNRDIHLFMDALKGSDSQRSGFVARSSANCKFRKPLGGFDIECCSGKVFTEFLPLTLLNTWLQAGQLSDLPLIDSLHINLCGRPDDVINEITRYYQLLCLLSFGRLELGLNSVRECQDLLKIRIKLQTSIEREISVMHEDLSRLHHML